MFLVSQIYHKYINSPLRIFGRHLGDKYINGPFRIFTGGEDAHRVAERASSMPRRWRWPSDLAEGRRGEDEGSRTRIPLVPDRSWRGDGDDGLE